MTSFVAGFDVGSRLGERAANTYFNAQKGTREQEEYERVKAEHEEQKKLEAILAKNQGLMGQQVYADPVQRGMQAQDMADFGPEGATALQEGLQYGGNKPSAQRKYSDLDYMRDVRQQAGAAGLGGSKVNKALAETGQVSKMFREEDQAARIQALSEQRQKVFSDPNELANFVQVGYNSNIGMAGQGKHAGSKIEFVQQAPGGMVANIIGPDGKPAGQEVLSYQQLAQMADGMFRHQQAAITGDTRGVDSFADREQKGQQFGMAHGLAVTKEARAAKQDEAEWGKGGWRDRYLGVLANKGAGKGDGKDLTDSEKIRYRGLDANEQHARTQLAKAETPEQVQAATQAVRSAVNARVGFEKGLGLVEGPTWQLTNALPPASAAGKIMSMSKNGDEMYQRIVAFKEDYGDDPGAKPYTEALEVAYKNSYGEDSPSEVKKRGLGRSTPVPQSSASGQSLTTSTSGARTRAGTIVPPAAASNPRMPGYYK